jgi:DNA-binding MurR/RpiR family transcriptional regulator
MGFWAEVQVNDRPFLQPVRDALNMLHPTERWLAGFLLNFPGKLASCTARAPTGLTNMSAPTVSRGIKRLAYTKYKRSGVMARL